LAESEPGLEAVVKAVRTADEAVTAKGAQDQIGLARLMKRLESERLLDDTASATRTRTPRNLNRWYAVAAGICVMAFGLQFVWWMPREPTEIYRGIAGTVSIAAISPEDEAKIVTRALQAIDLEPKRLPRPDRIVIEVVVDPEHLEAFRAWAEPRGAEVGGPGNYRVLIDKDPSAP
jgi:hypothetical protein